MGYWGGKTLLVQKLFCYKIINQQTPLKLKPQNLLGLFPLAHYFIHRLCGRCSFEVWERWA